MTSTPARPEVHRHVVVPVLVVLTVVTGIVDAVSFLALGGVFVAIMTGNVVFSALGLVGAPGVPLLEPAVALAAFLSTALATGRFVIHRTDHRGHVLLLVVAIELVGVLVAVALAATGLPPGHRGVRLGMVVVLAAGMGAQTAGVRSLRVPDFTTTLLTLALTGLAVDARPAGGPGGRPGRRLLSVAALLGGAVAGGGLVVEVGPAWPTGLVAALLAAVLGLVARSLRRTSAADWVPAS